MKKKLLLSYRIFLLIFTIAVIIFAVKMCSKYKSLKNTHKETVATIINIQIGYKFHKSYRYCFKVGNKEYFSSEEISEETKSVKIGQKYYVVYLPDDPEICKLKQTSDNYLIPAK